MHHPQLLQKQRVPAWYRFCVRPLFYLLSPIIIPLRFVFVIPFLVISSLTDFLLNLGTNPEEPLAPWRMAVYKVVKAVCYRMALVGLGIIPIVRGKSNQHVRAQCANHQSALDILVTAGTGINSSIAKAGIANNPFFGPTIRVTRSFLARGGANLDALRVRLTEEPQRFPPLGVFPGGTTSNQKVMPRFRTGIFHNKPSIQLVTIEYKTFENLFYVAVSGPVHILHILFNPLSLVYITYHPDIQTAREGETPQEYADRIGEEIARRVGGEYTTYTFKDCLWFSGNEALRSQLSDSYIRDQLWRGNCVEWAKRCRKVGLDPTFEYSKEELDAREAAAKKE